MLKRERDARERENQHNCTTKGIREVRVVDHVGNQRVTVTPNTAFFRKRRRPHTRTHKVETRDLKKKKRRHTSLLRKKSVLFVASSTAAVVVVVVSYFHLEPKKKK
jgi:hypothetical protein